MKNIKKLSALVLALILVLSLSAAALALDFNSGTGSGAGQATGEGEVGGFTTGNKDEWRDVGKSINIQKEITVYNPDEHYVYGPEITYTYAIAGASGTELVRVTDAPGDHASGVATVFDPVLAGTTYGGVTLTGTSANTIAWTNADILEASSTGTANIKKLAVDFSAVKFQAPGIYRYKITETATYDHTGVTNGDITNVRYLDVYVKRSANFAETAANGGTAGKTEYVADDWTIYGYVCISPESVVDDSDPSNPENEGGETAVTPSTTKTNGFVSDTTNSADEYYTYNLEIAKDLVGDNQMISHQFPFEVRFDTTAGTAADSSDDINGTFQLIVENIAPSTVVTTNTVVAEHTDTVNHPYDSTNSTGGTSAEITKLGANRVLSALDSGNSYYKFKLGDGNATTGTTTGSIKIIGIPYGVIATVTEQNDNVGTTYTASVKEDYNGTGLSAVHMTSTTGTESTDTTTSKKIASINYLNTATRTAAASDHNVKIEFTNKLAIISPTGVAFRVAPYVLMLAAGMFLILFSRRRREEAETA